MNKTTSYNDIYAEDLFKSSVKLEKDKLVLDPSVSPSFVWEFKKIVQKEIRIIYSWGEKLECPYCGEILNKNGYHPRLLNKTQFIELQKYKCTKKEGADMKK